MLSTDILGKPALASEEEEAVVEAVAALARDVIAPNAARYDEEGSFPWDSIEAINEMGLNGIFIPAEYGGDELSYSAYLACVREISAACSSTGITWATNYHAMKDRKSTRLNSSH